MNLDDLGEAVDLVLPIHAPRDRLEVPSPLEGVRLPTL